MEYVGITPNPLAVIGLSLLAVGLILTLVQARGDQAGGPPRRLGLVLALAGLATYLVSLAVWFLSPS